MKKLTISLAVSAIVVSGAFATPLEDAFAKGKVSGEVGAYTISTNNSGGTADSGYTMGSATLNFESEDINGFKASFGIMVNKKLDEKNSGYTKGKNSENVVLNVANVNYSTDKYSVTAGRQAIDLEWIADYHEAVVGVINTIPNTTIIVGHTEKFNNNANDRALSRFAKIGTDGANVLDVTHEINKTTKVGAYYMNAPKLFSAVGAKVETESNGLGVVAKYAKSNEDGNIMALDLGYKVGEIALNGGFIKAGKDNGVGSMATLGDNISPLDSADNKVYSTDAKTLYAGASTTVAGFELGGIYGTTGYKGETQNERESELNLTASWECKLVKNLNINALYANINAQTTDKDNSYYSLQLVYNF